MQLKASSIALMFVWCLFMGVTAISIGFGAIYPPMNRIAAPFVCPNGQMVFQQNVSNPLPGTTYITTAWNCVDGTTDRKTELGIFPMALYAGIIYGLLLFVVVFIGRLVLAQRRAANQPEFGNAAALLEESKKLRRSMGSSQESLANRLSKNKTAIDVAAKLTELKKLHEANLISEEEYQNKRAEILREL